MRFGSRPRAPVRCSALRAETPTRPQSPGSKYVLIGGLAAVLYGSAVVTNDADIGPSRADENRDELAAHAEPFVIEGTHVHVAALGDIIRSKETVNRVKDQAALPHLYALEDEMAARDDNR